MGNQDFYVFGRAGFSVTSYIHLSPDPDNPALALQKKHILNQVYSQTGRFTLVWILYFTPKAKKPTKTKQTKKPKLVIKHGKAKSRYKSAQESYLIFSFSTYC